VTDGLRRFWRRASVLAGVRGVLAGVRGVLAGVFMVNTTSVVFLAGKIGPGYVDHETLRAEAPSGSRGPPDRTGR
jgi:hypothetical protein